jgi:ubiquinone/menaquinone biosynthesis C-methylase UbiE
METSKERYIPALGFRLLTPLYDPVLSLTCREKKFKKILLEQADVKNDHSILDLGCGTGTFAIQISNTVPGVKIYSIDGDPKVLAIAKNKAKKENTGINFYGCYSSKLPFHDNSFDRVVSSLFFHHLSESEKLKSIAEVFRVLKPGGQFHVADWGKPTNDFMRLLFFSIQILDGFANTKDNVRGLLPRYFGECGFKYVENKKNLSTIYGTMSLYSARKPV